MLKLNSDRLNYGEQLRAPAGYTLDLAIATTFSVDLEALAASSLALNLDQTLEGEVGGEGLAMLESLDLLKDKLLVFYQRGNIKIPRQFNRLFSLLEPVLIPTESRAQESAAFSSFHPKLWMLRFVPDDANKPVRFRLLVLSRNLTFDRSWDIAVALDGVEGRHTIRSNLPLVGFLEGLPVTENHRAARLRRMCEHLACVTWDLNGLGFDEFLMLPGHASADTGGSKIPFSLAGHIDELLVISPFVDADSGSFLQELSARTRGTKTLISRGDTLDAIGKDLLSDWTIKSLSRQVVEGEELQGDVAPMLQDLHAKLIVAKQGRAAIWHVGSANMTNAAFGRPAEGIAPRNTEFMLKLEGSNHKAGPARLLEEWTDSGVFVNHEFRERATAPPEMDTPLRRLVHALTSVDWILRAKPDDQGTYSLMLQVTHLLQLPKGFSVGIGLLCRPAYALTPLRAEMTWNQVKLTEISAFIPVEVNSPTGSTLHFAVQAKLNVKLAEQRQRAIFRETVGDGAKLVRYLTLLLDPDSTKEKWNRANGNGSGGVFELIGRGALYEQLLRSAAQEPRRLRRALHVFEKMSKEDVTLPAGLAEIFQSFAVFAQDAI